MMFNFIVTNEWVDSLVKICEFLIISEKSSLMFNIGGNLSSNTTNIYLKNAQLSDNLLTYRFVDNNNIHWIYMNSKNH